MREFNKRTPICLWCGGQDEGYTHREATPPHRHTTMGDGGWAHQLTTSVKMAGPSTGAMKIWQLTQFDTSTSEV